MSKSITWSDIHIRKIQEISLLDISNLHSHYLNEFRKITEQKRKQEFLAIRSLVHEILGTNVFIIKDESGKPFLQEPLKPLRSMSITHGKTFCGFVVSPTTDPSLPVGLDIESISRFQKMDVSSKIPESWKPFAHGPKDECLLWTQFEALVKTGNISWGNLPDIKPLSRLKQADVLIQSVRFQGTDFKLETKHIDIDNVVSFAFQLAE